MKRYLFIFALMLGALSLFTQATFGQTPIPMHDPTIIPTYIPSVNSGTKKQNGPQIENIGLTVINFDDLSNMAAIGSHYPNISFNSSALCIVSKNYGGTGNFDNNPSGHGIMFFLSGAATMNVPSGFTTGFSFYYATSKQGSVKVYDGENGGGTLLSNNALVITSNPYYSWSTMGVTFSGTAKSIVFDGASNYCGFDDITFGSSTPGVPTNPADPSSISVSSSTVCNGTGATLTANGAVGTVYWYSGSCGGTSVTTGNPVTVYPSSSTTYHAKNNNGTFSTGCASATVNVNYPATAPTSASATPNTTGTASSSGGTYGANVNFSGAGGGSGTATYYWVVGTSASVAYGAGGAISGSTTSTSASFTSGLAASTTYYLRAYAYNGLCPASGYLTSGSFRTASVLSYTAGANGTLSGSTAQTIVNGGNGTAITANPNAHYNFVNWSDGVIANPRTDLNVTNSISVTANFAPNILTFQTQPVTKQAGQNIPLVLKLVDTYGNTMTNENSSITISIQTNPSIGSAGVLNGTLTRAAVNGVATFNDLWINKTGVGYKIIAVTAAPIVTQPISSSFTITPANIYYFTVAGITSTVMAGIYTTPTVTAYDFYDNIKTDYNGTITFTCNNVSLKTSAPAAPTVLPGSYTFLSANLGIKTFTNGVNLKQTGTGYYVKATGTTGTLGSGLSFPSAPLTGQQSNIAVTPAALDHFHLGANIPSGDPYITAGKPFTVTAEAHDLFENLKTNYTGSNNLQWTATANTSFNGTSRIIPANGNQTFAGGFSTISGFTFFNSHETPTITITDALTGKYGTTAAIAVHNNILDNFKVVAGTTQVAGTVFDLTVTARDIYWNTCIDYIGNIRLKSSNDALVRFVTDGSQQVLGGLLPYVDANHGVRTFSGQILINVVGVYWLRAADQAQPFISGQQDNIVVIPGAFSELITKSTLTISDPSTPATFVDPLNRIAGEYVRVIATPRDAQGNLLYACRNISIKINGFTSDYDGPIVVHNVGDGTYWALVRATLAGTNTISARFNADSKDWVQTRQVNVTPAIINLAHTIITAVPTTMTTDETSAITVQLRDFFDNNRPLTSNDGTVTLATTLGVLTGGVTNNGNNTYSATLHGNSSGVGSAVISGSFAGTGVSSAVNGAIGGTATVTITEGLPNLTTTTMIASPTSMTTDQSSTITVQLKDQFGNLIINNRGTLTMASSRGALAAVSYLSPGKYTAVLTGNNTGVGTANITGHFQGNETCSGVHDNMGNTTSVVITEGLPRAVQSAVTASPTTMTTDETSTITVQLKDQWGNYITHSRGTVSLPTNLGVMTAVTDHSDGTYTAVLSANNTGTGTATITPSIVGDASFTFNTHPTVVITEGIPRLSTIAITSSVSTMTTDETSAISIRLKDQWGNDLHTSTGTVTLTTTLGALTSVTNNANGTYSATLSANATGTGTATITGFFAGTGLAVAINGTIGHTVSVVITEGLPNLSQSTISANPDAITADQTSQLTVQLKDQWGNLLTHSRGSIALSNSLTGGNIGTVTDNLGGTYSAVYSLVSTGVGTATITGTFTGTGTASTVHGPITNNATIVVTNGVATKLYIATQPSSAATAGVNFAQQPVIRIEDHLSNLVVNDNSTIITAARSTGTATLQGTVTKTAVSGVASFSGIFYTKAESITLGFTASPVLTTTTSTSILVGHAPVNHFDLTAPADFIAGATRAAYTVTRHDIYHNLVTTGSQTVYLYSNSTGANKKFYTALTGGSVITSLTMADGAPTANFWYYDEKTSWFGPTGSTSNDDWTITASDNGAAPDAATGIIDGTDLIKVTPTLLKNFIVSGVPTPHNLGTWQSVSVEALDTYNNRKTNYVGTVTFSSTDIGATVPTDYPFQAGHYGIHTISGLKFSQIGSWWLTAIDLNESGKYGVQKDIIVRRAVNVTANNRTKVYGDVLTLGHTEFTATDYVSGLPVITFPITTVDFTCSGTGDHSNATTYTITPSNATVTSDAPYYNIIYVDGTLTVSKRPLTLSNFTASDKLYDGTTDVTGSGCTNNAMSWDSPTISYTAAFANKNAGINKTVTYTDLAISGGTGSGNYTLETSGGTATATISVRPINVTAYTATKIYDGTNACIVLPVVGALQYGDALTATGTQTFSDKHHGSTKTLTPGGTVINDGNSGANYNISYVTVSTGTINQAPLTITAQTATKIYDNTTNCIVLPVVTGLQFGDAITATGVETYNTEHAGTSKVLTPSGTTVNDGNSTLGSNYTYNYVNNSTGVINTADLYVTAQTSTKTYDGTTSSSVAPVVTNLQTGDAISTAAISTYDTKHFGSSKVLTPSGIVINDGNSGNDYVVHYVTNSTGVINKAGVTVTAQTQTKTYDGNATSSVLPVVGSLQFGDAITVTGVQTYDNRNYGTGKTLTPGGTVINDGNSGANYTISYVTNLTGVINKKSVTVTALTDTKVYDRTIASSVIPTISGIIAPDGLTATPTQTYDNYNAGTSKTLTPTALTGSLAISDGNSGNNYSVSYVTNTSGIITKKPITGTFTVSPTRIYNQTTASTILTMAPNDIITGDVVTMTGTATYNDKNVGTNKTVTLNGAVLGGTNASNYNLTGVPTVLANITVKTLTLSQFTADNKVYDGTTAAGGTGFADDRYSGDALTFQKTATFNTKNIGVSKAVNYTGIAILGGTDMNNYVLASSTGTAYANITAKPLTITSNDQVKCYGMTLSFVGTEFTTTTMATGETVSSVTLTSNGTSSGASPNTYPIVPSAPQGADFTNYNITYTNGTLTVTYSTSTVSGWIKYNNAAKTPMQNVTVQLKQGSSVIATTTTNSSGNYSFANICLGTYDVFASTAKTIGSINATDAGMVFAWGLAGDVGISNIENVQLMSGDVIGGSLGTFDNRLASNDATRILSYYVTAGNPLPTGVFSGRGNWVFWQAGLLTNSNTGSTNLLMPSATISGAGQALTLNMYAMASGDFNGDFTPGGAKSSSIDLDLTYHGTHQVGLNSEFDLPVRAVTGISVGAGSVVFNIPSSVLEVEDVTFNGNTSLTKQWKVIDNQLRIGWFSQQGINFSAGETVFTLKLKVKPTASGLDNLKLSLASFNDVELADGNYVSIPGAQLTIETINIGVGIGNQTSANTLTLNCFPNPFQNTTTLAYSIPENGKVSIEITNILGATVKVLNNETQQQGDHTLTLNGEIVKPGIYNATLRVSTESGILQQTIKIIRNQ
ncbi:MAG: YDG domain-containing protein [Bacteroidota bacterium]